MLSHKILEKTSVGNSVPTVVGVFNIFFYFFGGGQGFLCVLSFWPGIEWSTARPSWSPSQPQCGHRGPTRASNISPNWYKKCDRNCELNVELSLDSSSKRSSFTATKPQLQPNEWFIKHRVYVKNVDVTMLQSCICVHTYWIVYTYAMPCSCRCSVHTQTHHH